MAKLHSLTDGVPDCPECGGKGMCNIHKLEYLKHEYETALNAYEDEIVKQRKERERKGQERKQDEVRPLHDVRT